MRAWRGDLDGFFGLAVDNLIQFLLMLELLTSLCGMTPGFVVRHILPGAAVSLVAGNLFYAEQARRLARREGRTDVTALPFGINTVSLFGFVLFVMAPTFQDWAARPGVSREQAALVAWQVGLVACLLSGIIETAGAAIAGRVRRATPRAALLSTLAGIAVGFISMEFVLRTFQYPLVALVPLALLLARYLGRARLPGGLPAGLIALATGTGVAWGLHFAGWGGAPPLGGPLVAEVGFHPPRPAFGALFEALASPDVWGRISIIVPMGLINLLGALQNIESAEAEGDAFPTGPSLVANGVSSIVAAGFGSCFPTTIYIGHPGWKRLGARWGYSVMNGAFFTVLALTGLTGTLARLIPIEAGMAILIWIAMVIVAQAFTATPAAHAPAVVLGLLPGLAAWGWLLVELTHLGLRVGGRMVPDGGGLPEAMATLGATTMPWVQGLLTLKSGFMFSAMFLAAIAVWCVERRFARAALWCALAAAFTLAGLMHSYSLSATAVREEVRPLFAWPAAAGYLGMAAVFLGVAWQTRRRGAPATSATSGAAATPAVPATPGG